MATAKVQHLYDEIREITQQIGELGLPAYFMERIKTAIDPSWLNEKGNFTDNGGEEQLIALLNGELKGKSPELYEKMQAFFEEYNEEDPENPELRYTEVIFQSSSEDDPDLIRYNPDEIDPINLCFLMVFGDCAVEEDDLFMDYEDFYPYVQERNPELAAFMKEYPFISYFNLAQFVCGVNR